MRLVIEGKTISMVCLAAAGPPVRLEFWGKPVSDLPADYTLEIEGAFELTLPDSGVRRYNPEDRPHADVTKLLGTRVVSAIANDDGSLQVSFEDESVLRIPKADWEPWQLVREGQPIVVSGAGGGLHEWEDDSS
jgi:hypothetical protein